MKQQPANFLEWRTKHAAEKDLRETLTRRRNRSIFTKCGHERAYQLKSIPAHIVDQRLPSVHFVTSKFKQFVESTFQGVSHKSLQEYIDLFVFRFNRRFLGKSVANSALVSVICRDMELAFLQKSRKCRFEYVRTEFDVSMRFIMGC